MDDPFIGEIQMIAFTFAPKDWAFCYGQEMEIDQNMSLYSLLGVQFGGNASTYFNVPDLRGRTPVMPYPSLGLIQGMKGGVENATISEHQMAAHTHQAKVSEQQADSRGIGTTDGVRAFGSQTEDPLYAPPTNLTPLDLVSMTPYGNENTPSHFNIQPTQVLKYVIALKGYYPARS